MTTRRYNLKDNQTRAFNKMIRVSHRKLGLVADTVRGKPVGRAMEILKFSRKRCASEVLKTVMSAVANAEHNQKLSADSLFIKEIWCGKTLVMKRIMPKKQGTAHRIEKPFSNLTVILEAGEPVKKEAKPKSVAADKPVKTDKKETKK